MYLLFFISRFERAHPLIDHTLAIYRYTHTQKHMIIHDDELHVEEAKLEALYMQDPPLMSTTIGGPLNNTRVLITGGAGFVGSHLVDRLMLLGCQVTVIDDLSTGCLRNISHWTGNPKFIFIQGDVMDANTVQSLSNLDVRFQTIFHLASPASPPHYQRDPVKTLMTNVQGTLNMLKLAQIHKSRFILASTSEVYGDPLEHPQRESYHGNVNTTGPRACYDEGKRCAETLCSDFCRLYNVDVIILRIFNTFGPRMQPDDGRVISNFIVSGLLDKALQVHGDGLQTRSFQYISDLIDAFVKAAFCKGHTILTDTPLIIVNIGCPFAEDSVIGLAGKILDSLRQNGHQNLKHARIEHVEAMLDDPKQRQPDIQLAREILNWQPRAAFAPSLQKTIAYFERTLSFKS